jgi:hypothetical protein
LFPYGNDSFSVAVGLFRLRAGLFAVSIHPFPARSGSFPVPDAAFPMRRLYNFVRKRIVSVKSFFLPTGEL